VLATLLPEQHRPTVGGRIRPCLRAR